LIDLFKPFLNKELITIELSKLFDGKTIGEGPRVKEFEEKVANYLGQINLAMASFKVHTVAVNSGTSALHLAYILAGIKKDDEVIVPVLTCTATNHPLLWLGAKPIFADIEPDTLCISADDIESKITAKTTAIVVMHNGGHPCDMRRIMDIAERNNLKVIEDCAQAFGGEYDGQKLGTFGDFGIFSFQAIKHVTTGDGGMLICRNEGDAKRAKKLRWYGIDRDLRRERNTLIPDKFNPFWQRAMTFDVEETGFKMHMNDIAATIGLCNFEKINEILNQRKLFANIYRKELTILESGFNIKLLEEQPGHANWLFQILVDNVYKFQEFISLRGIETNQVQIRNDYYKIFGGEKLNLPNMNSVETKYVSLPIHNNLSEEDIYSVVDAVKEYAQT